MLAIQDTLVLDNFYMQLHQTITAPSPTVIAERVVEAERLMLANIADQSTAKVLSATRAYLRKSHSLLDAGAAGLAQKELYRLRALLPQYQDCVQRITQRLVQLRNDLNVVAQSDRLADKAKVHQQTVRMAELCNKILARATHDDPAAQAIMPHFIEVMGALTALE